MCNLILYRGMDVVVEVDVVFPAGILTFVNQFQRQPKRDTSTPPQPQIQNIHKQDLSLRISVLSKFVELTRLYDQKPLDYTSTSPTTCSPTGLQLRLYICDTPYIDISTHSYNAKFNPPRSV